MKSNIRRTSIKTRLCFIVVLTLLSVLLGQSFIAYWQSRAIVEQMAFDAATTSAHQNAALIDTWIRGKGERLQMLSKTDIMRSMNWAEQLPLLQEIVKAEDDIEALFIADVHGRATSTTGETISITDRDYFQQALRTGEVTYSQPTVSRFTGVNTVVVAQPIAAGDLVVGVLGMTLLLDHLQNLVQDMKISGYGHGWIIDANGNTIAHPNAQFIGNQNIFTGNPELRILADEMLAGHAGLGFYHLNGTSKGLAYAPIPVTNWSIAMTANTRDILAPAVRLRNSSIIITLAAIAAGVVIAYLSASHIVNPIIRIRDLVQRVADGDLTVDVDMSSGDEIGQLGDAVRRMAENLRMLIGAIHQTTEQLNASSQQLNSNCEEMAASAQETAATMSELTGTVQQIVADVQVVSNASSDTARQANEGNEGIVQVTAQMDNIGRSSQRMAESIRTLHDQTKEINQVLGLIRNFADQTNLLALNATIEAARAGEAGRGFAVVANEVRSLAEQSAEATTNIQALLDTIVEESAEVVEFMGLNQRDVGEGSNVVKRVGEHFLRIIGGVQNLNRQFEHILSATQQMAAAIEQISAASQEQTASSEEVAQATEQLTQLSQSLNDMVQRFQV
ncbi:MAG: methyl-accepting chemotaxis protein [Limnochordia bacterium]